MSLHRLNCPKCLSRTGCDPKRTSSLYETLNLPYRFDNPGQYTYMPIIQINSVAFLSVGQFRGYGIQRADNVAYYTSNSEYGRNPPTVHTVPLR